MESSIAPGLLTPSPLAPYGRAVGGEGPRRREQGGLAEQNKGTFLGTSPKKPPPPSLPFCPSPVPSFPVPSFPSSSLGTHTREAPASPSQVQCAIQAGRRSRRKKRSIEQLRSEAGAWERDAKRRSNFLPRLSQVTSCDRLASQKRPLSI